MRHAAHERTAELEIVYTDNDNLKTKLTEISMKYDFESIDTTEKTL